MTPLPVLPPLSCEECGQCCQGIGSPILIYATRPGWREHHPYRPVNLPAELAAEIDEHFAGLVRGQEPQEQCLWYDAASRSCKHYDLRPQVCRDYELGGRACLTLRKLHGIESPGGLTSPRSPSHGATS